MYASLIKAYAKFYRLLLFRSSPKRVLIDTYSRVLPMIGIGKLCLSSLQFLIKTLYHSTDAALCQSTDITLYHSKIKHSHFTQAQMQN